MRTWDAVQGRAGAMGTIITAVFVVGVVGILVYAFVASREMGAPLPSAETAQILRRHLEASTSAPVSVHAMPGETPAVTPLKPERNAPVRLEGVVARVEDRLWQVQLAIVNQSGGIVEGTVWAVANMKDKDGRKILAGSDPGLDLEDAAAPRNAAVGIPYKARWKTFKTLTIPAPDDFATPVLESLAVYVSSAATGDVVVVFQTH